MAMIVRLKITIILTLIFLALLLMTSSLDAQVQDWEEQLKVEPDNQQLLLKLGKHYHNLAGEGNSSAQNRAEKCLSKLLSLDPNNALALVYYGSVLTMKARDAGSSWDAMEFLRTGFTRMDKAVILAPKEAEVRLIRGINSLHIPEEFQRLFLALEDFQAIESLIATSDRDWEKEFLLPYYFYFGEALAKNRNKEGAAAKWRAVCRLDPQSDYGRIARKRLGDQ